MSEQSGPITREQVERAIAKPRNIDYRELPLGWRELAPDYVIAAEAADDWDAEHAALTRWRDELAAAERSHGKVARWDAARGAYVALDDHGTVCMITPDRETAIGWGYGVAPAEDSPERLRERRDALGRRIMSALDLDALERRARKGIVLNPDETLALITRLRAAEARTAWQPIETAPLDEWVWVASEPHRGAKDLGHTVQVWKIKARLEAGWWVVSDGNTFAQEPTHWAHIQRPPRLPWLAPLPTAPEAP